MEESFSKCYVFESLSFAKAFQTDSEVLGVFPSIEAICQWCADKYGMTLEEAKDDLMNPNKPLPDDLRITEAKFYQ